MFRAGELFDGELAVKYRARSTLPGFQRREINRDDNDVLYWGNAIIDWMISMINVFGVRQAESAISYGIDQIVVDPSSAAAVNSGWVEMRRLYTQLPEDQAGAAVQMSRWHAKLCQAGWYGKKWSTEIHAYREKHTIGDWSLETMESAQTYVTQLAEQMNNTWLMEAEVSNSLTAQSAPTGKSRKVVAATVAATAENPRMGAPGQQGASGMCAHCYGYHKDPATKGKGCYHRDQLVNGEYPGRETSLGFNLERMRWLGTHEKGDKRFYTSLSEDPAFLKLATEEQTKLVAKFKAIGVVHAERSKQWKDQRTVSVVATTVEPRASLSSGEEGETAPGERHSTAESAPGPGELGFIEGAVLPVRTLVKMSFAEAVNEGEGAGPGPLLFFTSTMWSAGNGESVTLPVGGDTMSEISLVSRQLVGRMKWEEHLMTADRWFGLKGCMEGMEGSTVKTQVKIMHTIRGDDGSVLARSAMHYVIEDATFDVLIGNDVLAPWGGKIDLGNQRLLLEDAGVQRSVHTYGLSEAVSYVQKHESLDTKQSAVWRSFAKTARCLAVWAKKDHVNQGVHLKQDEWKMVNFGRQSDATVQGECVYRVLSDKTQKWTDVTGVVHKTVEFAEIGYCRDGLRIFVRNLTDYPIELSKGDIVLRADPTVRRTCYVFEEAVEPEAVKVACSTLTADMQHLLERPPAILPEEAGVLWHAMSPDAKLKLHEFANTEGVDPAMQRSQLRDLFMKLDIYDSGVTVDKGPWMAEGEELRVPKTYLEALLTTYPQLRTEDDTVPPGSSQGEGIRGPGGDKNLSKSMNSAGPVNCSNQEDRSGSI